MADAYVDYVEVYRDAERYWRWRAKADNGETVADSGEGYTTHAGAVRAAEGVFPDAPVREPEGD